MQVIAMTGKTTLLFGGLIVVWWSAAILVRAYHFVFFVSSVGLVTEEAFAVLTPVSCCRLSTLHMFMPWLAARLPCIKCKT